MPELVSCDDHEFWNDFPEPQMHVPFSWQRYAPDNGAACTELYDAYQASLNPGGRRWTSFRVTPISFFIADTRSNRTRDTDPHAALTTEEQWRDLESRGRPSSRPGRARAPAAAAEGRRQQDRPHARRLQGVRPAGAIFEQRARRQTATASRTTS